ncbi:carboxymuconolactone decarboxylase family protein [Chloroflexus sp.]|uniref:carboxymuconolactone decarboxylase family protein n=1 Tax=Chloroflexus sp. TaxID=1904827 RepID=UPI002ADE15B8|nr:carboxymuconolactone decarboxylase family protein [Chloroflexus sp.]
MEDITQEITHDLGFGIMPNVFAYAKSTDTQIALWKAFRHMVLRGVLPRTVKEMMGVIISQARGSRYAAEIHLHALMVQGLEAKVLDALRRGVIIPTLPGKVQALLQFAQSAAVSPHPQLLAGLQAVGLSEVEIQEAVAVVGVFTLINNWTDMLEIPVDPL